METVLSICLGLGLSAACGFRIFVPLLCLSIAAVAGHVELAQGFSWIGTMPALVSFAVATTLEVCAYYLPVVDNFLDSLAIPAATVAGMIATASCVADTSALVQWTTAVIAGGGIAATTQLVTTKLRLLSTATTAGLGNAPLATAEAGGSTLLSLLSLIWPIVGITLVIALILGTWFVLKRLGGATWRLFRRVGE